jgi:hypothetical protein
MSLSTARLDCSQFPNTVFIERIAFAGMKSNSEGKRATFHENYFALRGYPHANRSASLILQNQNESATLNLD